VSALAPGTQITPSITLVKPLGAGGMGSVWVADHKTLRTQVVVKFLHAELASNEAHLERFSREAAAAANVKSPHVVQVLDHGLTDANVPFIVMELLEGEDLGTHLEAVRTMPISEIATIITQVCKALGKAHERGIVHRDIKPQNLFLCHEGGELFVKVLDFGIAKSTSAQLESKIATHTGATLGTPYYMSPEQVMGAKTVDFRTDLWALGVVAFEAMTGTRPFDGETIGALSVAICTSPLPKPSDRGLDNAAVDAWFAQACAREAGDRFASAREMASAFNAATSSSFALAKTQHDVRVTPPQAITPPPALSGTTSAPVSDDGKPTAPKSRLPIIAAIVGVAAIAVGATFYMRNNDTKPQAAPPPAVTAKPSVEPIVSLVQPVLSAVPSASSSASVSTAASTAPAHATTRPHTTPSASASTSDKYQIN
jgi:serine/threonine-protein kinase